MLNFGAAKEEETKETLAVGIICVECMCVCVCVCVCARAQCQLQSEDKSRLSPDP